MALKNSRNLNSPPATGPLRQLSRLIALLLLVLLFLNHARHPGTWTWLTDLNGGGPAPHAPAGSSTKTRVATDELPPGVFLAAASNRVEDPPQAGGVSRQGGEVLSDLPPPELDPLLFEGVRDVTRSIPVRPYFDLLDMARRTPDELFERQASRELTFAHLAARPELYRGHALFLKGHVRRMTEIPVSTNAQGFKKLYEGWLFTEESQDNPYVIIASRVPEGFPLGGSIVEDVSFAGYFLKLWAYRAGDGERYAPLLLGSRIVWHPRPARPRPATSLHLGMFGAVITLAVALVLVARWGRRHREVIRQRYQPAHQPASHEVQSLGEQAAPSTQEFLAEMEQE